jgi:hypothetical protein
MNASADTCKQFILEKSVGPISGCVTVAVPSITPVGMGIRVAVTTTSFVLHALDIIPEYQDTFISQVFDNPVRGTSQTIMSVYESCTNDA